MTCFLSISEAKSDLKTAIWEVIPTKICPIKSEVVLLKLKASQDYRGSLWTEFSVLEMKKIDSKPDPSFDWDKIGYEPVTKSTVHFREGWGMDAQGNQIYTRLEHEKGSGIWEFTTGNGTTTRNLIISLTGRSRVKIVSSLPSALECTLVNNKHLDKMVMNYFNSLPVTSDRDLLNYFKQVMFAHEKTDAAEAATEHFNRLLKSRIETRSTENGELISIYISSVLEIYFQNYEGEKFKNILLPFLEKLSSNQLRNFGLHIFEKHSNAFSKIIQFLLENRKDEVFFKMYPLDEEIPKSSLAWDLIENNRMDLLQLALTKHRNSPTYFSDENFILTKVIIFKNYEVLKILLQNNFKVSTSNLCFFMRDGQSDEALLIVQSLIDSGVPLQATQSCNPLIEAIELENYRMMDLLIANHADINFLMWTPFGKTPLYATFRAKNLLAAKKILEAGGDLALRYQFQLDPNKPMTICELIHLAVTNAYPQNHNLPKLWSHEAAEFQKIYCP